MGTVPSTTSGAHEGWVPAGRVDQAETLSALTHDQSVAILDDAVQWLIDEAKANMAMPTGPSKDRRRAELRGRHESMVREFARLVRKQEG